MPSFTITLLRSLLQFLQRKDALETKLLVPAICPHCKAGHLHADHYRRVAWGFPPPEGDTDSGRSYILRLSWCCGKCRTRFTPPSSVFMGRRRYVAPIVLAQSAQATGASVDTKELKKPSRRTIQRWLTWWREDFTKTKSWFELTGLLMCNAYRAQLPGILTEYFPTWSLTRLLLAGLALVRPCTGGCQAM